MFASVRHYSRTAYTGEHCSPCSPVFACSPGQEGWQKGLIDPRTSPIFALIALPQRIYRPSGSAGPFAAVLGQTSPKAHCSSGLDGRLGRV
jgi:hypothetical protein